jgi:hypothetical protein
VNGPRLVNVIAFAILGLVVAVVVIMGITKARLGGRHAERENERRPRSIAAEGDPSRPDWFRNMDKDTDGRLSRTEFIGTDEQFKQIDTNGDQFISPAEARAADAWFRAQVPR